MTRQAAPTSLFELVGTLRFVYPTTLSQLIPINGARIDAGKSLRRLQGRQYPRRRQRQVVEAFSQREVDDTSDRGHDRHGGTSPRRQGFNF